MKSISRFVLLSLSLLIFSNQAYALRCGTKLVSVGDNKHKVLNLCGEPSYIENYQQPQAFYPSHQQNVEVWTYNYGRSRFMQEMQFENGVLRRIKQLGYGY